MDSKFSNCFDCDLCEMANRAEGRNVDLFNEICDELSRRNSTCENRIPCTQIRVDSNGYPYDYEY